MTLFERISELAKKQHIGLKELAVKLGLSESTIYQWRKSSPKAESLEKVADYFHTTTDYLLGRTDNPNIPTSLEEDFGDLMWDEDTQDFVVKDENEEDLLAAFRMESEDMSDDEKKKFNKSLKDMMKIAKGLLNDDSKWEK